MGLNAESDDPLEEHARKTLEATLFRHLSHERLTPYPSGGKSDMCRCGTPADFCAGLREREAMERRVADSMERHKSVLDRLREGEYDQDCVAVLEWDQARDLLTIAEYLWRGLRTLALLPAEGDTAEPEQESPVLARLRAAEAAGKTLREHVRVAVVNAPYHDCKGPVCVVCGLDEALNEYDMTIAAGVYDA